MEFIAGDFKIQATGEKNVDTLCNLALLFFQIRFKYREAGTALICANEIVFIKVLMSRTPPPTSDFRILSSATANSAGSHAIWAFNFKGRRFRG